MKSHTRETNINTRIVLATLAYFAAGLVLGLACNNSGGDDNRGRPATQTAVPSVQPIASTSPAPGETEDPKNYPTFQSLELASNWGDMSAPIQTKDPIGFSCVPTKATTIASKSGAEVSYECTLLNHDKTAYTGSWSLDELDVAKKSNEVEILEVDVNAAQGKFTFVYPSALTSEIKSLNLTIVINGETLTRRSTPVK